MADNKKKNKPKSRDSNKSDTLFGGLTGRAEKAMKNRKSRINKAVNKASGKKKKK